MAVNLSGKKTSLKDNASIYEKRNDELSAKEQFKHMSAKEKRTHFATYYLPTVLVILAIIAVIGYIFWADVINKKNTYLHCAVLNEVVIDSEFTELSDTFTKSLNMDPEEDKVSFYTYYTNPDIAMKYNADAGKHLTEISSRLVASMLDCMIASAEDVESSYLENGFIQNLRTILTEEEYTKLEPYLYIPEHKDNPNKNAFGIYLTESPVYQKLFTNTSSICEKPIFYIVSNASEEGKANAIKLLYYLFPDVLN